MMLEYTLTQEEIIEFHKNHSIGTLYYKSWLFVMCTQFLVILCFFIFMVIRNYEFKLITIVYTIGVPVVLLFRKKIFLFRINKRLKNIYSKYNKKYLFSPIILEFNENDILFHTNIQKKLVKWEWIKYIYVMNNTIILRLLEDEEVFIPSRAIKSDNEMKLLINLFEKKINTAIEYNYPKDIKFILNY